MAGRTALRRKAEARVFSCGTAADGGSPTPLPSHNCTASASALARSLTFAFSNSSSSRSIELVVERGGGTSWASSWRGSTPSRPTPDPRVRASSPARGSGPQPAPRLEIGGVRVAPRRACQDSSVVAVSALERLNHGSRRHELRGVRQRYRLCQGASRSRRPRAVGRTTEPMRDGTFFEPQPERSVRTASACRRGGGVRSARL